MALSPTGVDLDWDCSGALEALLGEADATPDDGESAHQEVGAAAGRGEA